MPPHRGKSMTYLSPGRAVSRGALALYPPLSTRNQPDPIRIFVQNLCSPPNFHDFSLLWLWLNPVCAGFFDCFGVCTTLTFFFCQWVSVRFIVGEKIGLTPAEFRQINSDWPSSNRCCEKRVVTQADSELQVVKKMNSVEPAHSRIGPIYGWIELCPAQLEFLETCKKAALSGINLMSGIKMEVKPAHLQQEGWLGMRSTHRDEQSRGANHVWFTDSRLVRKFCVLILSIL